MLKFRMYYDKDKEQIWLNEMADKGYEFRRFFAGLYWFQKGEPGQYRYQIDFGDGFGTVTKEYREFMEEVGVTVVHGWGPWIYLKKAASEGEFDLYSDVDSQIEHYKKIQTMYKGAAILEIICFFVEIMCAMMIEEIWPIVLAIIALVFAVAIMRGAVTTTKILAKLYERKGETNRFTRQQTPSLLLPFGLLLNSLGLILKHVMGEEEHWSFFVITSIAIVFMLVGIYRTAYNIRRNQE